MNRIVSVCLMMVLATTAFATGEQEQQSEGTTQLVLAIWGGDNDTAAFEAMIAAAADSLEGIEVEILLFPRSEFDQTITTRIVGGQQIDVIGIAESVHQFSSRNQLLPLNDLATAAGLDLQERFGANKDLYARDGNVYALPLRGGPMIIYSNMDVLAQKPEIDWTFEQFMDAAVGAFTPGATLAETTWGFVPAGDGTWWPWYTSFIYAAGGSILDLDGRPNFDDPATVRGLENYAAFIHRTGVGPSLEDMADLGQTSPDPLFNSGRAAMIATGWWNVGSLQDADFHWDIAPIPNGNGRGTVVFGQGLAVTSVSEHAPEAFRLVEALTDVAAQESIIDSLWDIPANVQVLSSDAFLNAAWSANELDMAAVADAIAQGAISLPYNPEWNQMQDVIGNVVNELLAGNIDAAQAAARIQADLLSQVF